MLAKPLKLFSYSTLTVALYMGNITTPVSYFDDDESFSAVASHMLTGWEFSFNKAFASCGTGSEPDRCPHPPEDYPATIPPACTNCVEGTTGHGTTPPPPPNVPIDTDLETQPTDPDQGNTAGGSGGESQPTANTPEGASKEQLLDTITLLTQIKNALAELKASPILSPQAKAALAAEISKVGALMGKLNVVISLVNTGVQVTDHLLKSEIGNALSEVAGLLSGFGIALLVDNPIGAIITAFAASYIVEYTGDELVVFMEEYTGVSMREVEESGGVGGLLCRTFAGASGQSDSCSGHNRTTSLPPIILDLTGNGIKLTTLENSKAAFDLDNDGRREKLSWFGAGNAIVVYDINKSNIVDDVREFALAGLAEKSGQSDLAGLKTLDSNHDNIISDKDIEYSSLFAWQDNGDGICQESEMIRFEDMNIIINLQGEELYEVVNGNVIANKLTYSINGKSRTAVDVFLQTNMEKID